MTDNPIHPSTELLVLRDARRCFCCAGISRASSTWRFRSSILTVTPRLGLALIQTAGSVQSSPASMVAM